MDTELMLESTYIREIFELFGVEDPAVLNADRASERTWLKAGNFG